VFRDLPEFRFVVAVCFDGEDEVGAFGEAEHRLALKPLLEAVGVVEDTGERGDPCIGLYGSAVWWDDERSTPTVPWHFNHHQPLPGLCCAAPSRNVLGSRRVRR